MRKNFFNQTVFSLACLLVFAFPRASFTQDEPRGTQTEAGAMGSTAGMDKTMDKEAMMAKWKEYATPNENHKVLEVFVGSWEHTVKHWQTPDAPPEESTGTSEVKWIMDGRYIQQEASGTAMGQPFQGMGIIGYDNGKKEYVSVWLDNMGTGVMSATGQYDQATQTLTEKGNFTCPIMGPMDYRGVTKILDDDHYMYELYGPGMNGTREFKMMEISYTRKK